MTTDFRPLPDVEVTPVYGVPGAGKTTYCVNLIKQLIEDGEDPRRIVFCSYTRTASYEGADRVAKALGLSVRSLREQFTTIHALCKRNADEQRKVMRLADYRAVASKFGLSVMGGSSEDSVELPGDYCIGAYNGMRARMLTPDAFFSLPGVAERTKRRGLTVSRVQAFFAELERYKKHKDLIDFADMLDDGIASQPLDVDFAIVDEAQDASLHQWHAVDNLLSRCTRVWVAGDDDQAIYDFAGGCSPIFRAFANRPEVVKLEQSYRCPRRIFAVADRAIRRCQERVPKTVRPRQEPGNVTLVPDFRALDMSEGSWLILVRRHRDAGPVYEHLQRRKLLYTSTKGHPSVSDRHRLMIRAYEQLRTDKLASMSVIPSMVHALDSFLVEPGAKKRITEVLGKERGDRIGLERLIAIGGGIKKEIRHYPWHEALVALGKADRTYYQTLMEAGHYGVKNARIDVRTIHGAKGTEADNVVMLAQHGRNQRESLQAGEDHEHRIAYVGATRARENLFIVSGIEREKRWDSLLDYVTEAENSDERS
jgi:superfamily I DNA/RNA helicase